MKLKYIVYGICLMVLASCGSKKKVHQTKKNKTVVVKEDKPKTLPDVKQEEHVEKLEDKKPFLPKTTLAYIEEFAPIAVKEMHLYNIPASITLAQGILESNSGNSELSRRSNNHFGIKCHTNWEGEKVYHDDDELGECFRKYQYVETSFKDHSLFLSQRKRYAFLFEYGTSDYKSWARGLQKAGYATDKRYPEKLIKIIEDYELYKFDKASKKGFDLTEKEEDTTNYNSYYKVVAGDTLYSISKKFGITVEALKKLNNLDDNTISIGQVLKLE